MATFSPLELCRKVQPRDSSGLTARNLLVSGEAVLPADDDHGEPGQRQDDPDHDDHADVANNNDAAS